MGKLTPALVLLAVVAAASWLTPRIAAHAAGTPPAAPTTAPATSAPVATPSPGDAPAPAGPSADDVARQKFVEWLRARLPPGGRVDDAHDGVPEVVHTTAAGDTALTIARAYVDLTDLYDARDLAAAIAKEQPDLRPATEVRIPHLLAAPYRGPEEERMARPADRALRGIYIMGETAGTSWAATLERVRTHGMNAIVLDAKAYAGTITYPTQVALAREGAVSRSPPIPDLARAIRFAHDDGIAVIVRLTCFHDPWLAFHHPKLSIRLTSGGPSPMGWVDPANATVQDYLVGLVTEVIDLGADEVQLDYVRFPTEDTHDAVMLPPDGHRTRAIAAFVARVHDVAAARHVPLSLDVFGIAGSAPRSDIEVLGQDLRLLGPVAEAISPMVYPSHYPVGTLGFDRPGDHPELVGFGTKATVTRLASGDAAGTIVRPWLQAASFRTSEFGPKYIQDEIRSAEANGAVGWLMWDAGNSYWAVWRALPVVKDARLPVASRLLPGDLRTATEAR